MKALVVSALSTDLSGTALADLPEPQAAPDKVLIRVRAAATSSRRRPRRSQRAA